MGYTGSEKRKYKRINHQFYTNFRVYTEGESKESFNWDITIIKNLSAGGMFFNYNKKLGLGMLIEFKLILSFIIEPIQGLGMVVRLEKNPSTRIYGIAAEFIKIANDDKEAIDRFIRLRDMRANQSSSTKASGGAVC